MFGDQSTVFYPRLHRGGGAAQGDRPRLVKDPLTETQSVASEGTMCSVDAHTADTHRISPL